MYNYLVDLEAKQRPIATSGRQRLVFETEGNDGGKQSILT